MKLINKSWLSYGMLGNSHFVNRLCDIGTYCMYRIARMYILAVVLYYSNSYIYFFFLLVQE